MSLLRKSLLNQSRKNNNINQQDKSLQRFDKVLSKLYDIDNSKIDALRLVYMYIYSKGRDINLESLIKKLKCLE